MGFDTVTPQRRQASYAGNATSISAYVSVARRENKNPSTTLVIQIGLSIMTQMQLQLGDRVAVLEGQNEDLGYLLLRKAVGTAAGYTVSKGGGSGEATYSRVGININSLKHLPRLSGRATATCGHMVFARELKVMLPAEWLVPSDAA